MLSNLRRRKRRASDDHDGHSSHAGRPRVPCMGAALRPHDTWLGRGDRGRRRGALHPRRRGERRRDQRPDRRAESGARPLRALRLRRAEPLCRVLSCRRRRGDGVPLRREPDAPDAGAISAGVGVGGVGARGRHGRRARCRDPQGAGGGVGATGHLHGSGRSRARQQRAGLPDRIGLPARGVVVDADQAPSRRGEGLRRRPRPSRAGAAPRRIPADGRPRAARRRPGRDRHRIGDHVQAHQPAVQPGACRRGRRSWCW